LDELALHKPTSDGFAPAENGGRIPKTVAYYLAFISLGLTTASTGPALPYLAAQTGSLLSAASFLFTTRSLGYMLGSLQGGRLYDRVRGHPVMAIALVVMAAMMATVPLPARLWLLTIIFLVLGISEGMLDVGGNTLLVWVHRHRVGPWMNALHFFFGVGSLLSPLILAQAVQASGGIGWGYWTLALLVLPVAAFLLYLPSPKALVARGTPESGLRAGSSSRRRNGLLVALFALFFFLFVGAEVGYAGWIFSYSLAAGLATATSAAYLTSAFWAALTVGRAVGIAVSARFRPSTILYGDLAGCLVSAAIILLWPESREAIWLGTLGMGFSMASIFAVTISLAERRMTITGRVTGYFFVGGSAGGMTLPWLMGQLFESIAPRAAMVAILLVIVLTVGVLAALLSYSARHHAPAPE
jgi:FHS family Na+ dependent glucose MFS transporter 1